MATVSSSFTATVPVSIASRVEWTFVAPDDPTIKVTGVTVKIPLNSQVTESVGIFRPLGREKAVVVGTTIFGIDGEYEFFTVGDTEWTALEPLMTYQGSFFVTDPIGRSKYVRFTSRNLTEEGPSGNLRRRLRVSYVEVDAPPSTTGA
jgi:hypothetical protein